MSLDGDWRRVLGSSLAPSFSGADTVLPLRDSERVDLGMFQEREGRELNCKWKR